MLDFAFSGEYTSFRTGKRKKSDVMKISTQGRYGARILIDHATHDPEKTGMLEDVVRSREREINIKLNNRNMMGAYDTEKPAALFIQDGVQFAGKVQAPDAVSRSQHLEGTQRRHPLTHLEDHPRRNTERLPQAGRRKRHRRKTRTGRAGGRRTEPPSH